MIVVAGIDRYIYTLSASNVLMLRKVLYLFMAMYRIRHFVYQRIHISVKPILPNRLIFKWHRSKNRYL